MYIYSHNQKSRSAKMLATALDAKIIRHTLSLFRGASHKTVINWGSSGLPDQVHRSQVVNKPGCVANAINKIRTFNLLTTADVRVVPFTVDAREARLWLERGERVFARTRFKGHDGQGIVDMTSLEFFTPAPLYTKYIHAEKEYRITVCNGKAVFNQRKVRVDTPPLNGYNDSIKTTAGGYGFKAVTLNIPQGVQAQSIAAVEALGLVFGGVDVLWDGTRAYVLEINTAPALTPLSCQALADALIEYLV